MSKAIGGYVRRCERRVTEPDPGDTMRGPDWYRHAVLPSGGVITWRAEPPAYEMPLLSSTFLPAGELSEPGPPYVHTFASPEPIGYTEDGDPIYPPPGPAYTLTER